MYLITAYFDEKTNNILKRHIDEIARITGNTYMTDNHVPPHMTLCALEARNVDVLTPGFKEFVEASEKGEVIIASVAEFFPYVMYAAPVPNNYLMDISKRLNNIYGDLPEVSVSRYYSVDHWLPHITLAKRLDEEQMLKALEIMRSSFTPINAVVSEVGLSEVNPHRDVLRISL